MRRDVFVLHMIVRIKYGSQATHSWEFTKHRGMSYARETQDLQSVASKEDEMRTGIHNNHRSTYTTKCYYVVTETSCLLSLHYPSPS